MGVISKLRGAALMTGYEVQRDVYTGKADRYIVYNAVTETPGNFADNAPQTNTLYFQAHIYLPRKVDYQPVQNMLRKYLFEAGFSYPRVTLNIVEEDTDKRHICIETNIETEVEE